MSLPDLVVAGGGIVGLTSALAAARRGLRVTLVDQSRAGAASRSSAGMLAPSIGTPAHAASAAIQARDHFPPFLDELRDRTGIAVPLDRNGVLELAATGADREALFERQPSSAERLDAAALAALEPALGAHAGALLHPLDGAVDNGILMDALDVAVARQPLITRLTDEVASFDGRGNVPGFRSRGGSRYGAPRLLLANGAWAGSLPGLPRALPVRPVRGQLLRLDVNPIAHVVYGAGGYLVPRGASLIVGATSEEVGFESETTRRGLKDLRAIAVRAIPGLEDAQVAAHWAGLRPVSIDGLPLVGSDPDFPALVYACGFSRNGILFAPWAAEQMVPLLTGGPAPWALAPFGLAGRI